jgi:hypothetical protein
MHVSHQMARSAREVANSTPDSTRASLNKAYESCPYKRKQYVKAWGIVLWSMLTLRFDKDFPDSKSDLYLRGRL